jgi:hypothetical protein
MTKAHARGVGVAGHWLVSAVLNTCLPSTERRHALACWRRSLYVRLCVSVFVCVRARLWREFAICGRFTGWGVGWGGVGAAKEHGHRHRERERFWAAR